MHGSWAQEDSVFLFVVLVERVFFEIVFSGSVKSFRDVFTILFKGSDFIGDFNVAVDKLMN